MKQALIILLAVVTFNLSAQDHYVGLQTGLNVSNVNQRLINSNPLVGFSGGLSYKGVIANHLLIGTDVLYSQRGYKTNLNLGVPGFEIPAFDAFGIDFEGWEFDGINTGLDVRNIKNRAEYISVPLKMGYIGGGQFKGYAQVGVVPSFLQSATLRVPVFLINDISLDVERFVNKTDWAGLVEAGFIFDINEFMSFQGSVNYQQSFTPYYTGIIETFTGSNANNLNFSVGLAKKF